MKEFKRFFFEDFSFDETTLEAKFLYSFDEEIFFEEKISFFCEWFSPRKNLDKNILENALFHLFISLWISYYKSFPTKDLVVKNYDLESWYFDFWKKFYKNWLWEFFFLNDINPKDLLNFSSSWDKKINKVDFDVSERSLVPIWWWKDSLVTIEDFIKKGEEFDIFTFWKTHELHDNVSSEIPANRLIFKRQLSPKIFELNSAWYYNWHIPITWIIAFVMVVWGYIYDYKYLVLSNEYSANFWNVNHFWYEINHQWSKSLEFEKDFKEFTSKFFSDKIHYFSYLRDKFEVKIAKEFCENKKYFDSFSSCNNNFKIDKNNKKTNNRWCNSCPKCLFVFSILRPYLTDSEVIQIFWKDLFFDNSLLSWFKDLLWFSDVKPFECVWEAKEVLYCINLYLKGKNDISESDILSFVKNEILPKYDKKYFDDLEKELFWEYENLIPKKFK